MKTWINLLSVRRLWRMPHVGNHEGDDSGERSTSSKSLTKTCISFFSIALLLVVFTPPSIAAPIRSISEWAKCSETIDSAKSVATAFAAAKNGAFVLQVDCPVFIHIGVDIQRPIFIDNNTTVVFTPTGKFIVDNLFVPAFAIVGSTNVTLTNWNVQFSSIIPINATANFYYSDGVRVSRPSGLAPQAGGFNDITLKSWLETNRSLIFNQSKGRAFPSWPGPANTGAIFYFRGAASNITISGLKLFVPPTSGGNSFIPMAFSFNIGAKNGKTITNLTPLSSQSYDIPSNLTFVDIDLDGTYMGWQGKVKNTDFTRIRSHRYGDVQDAAGNNVGGVGKWFPPPHLFYLNYAATDKPLVTQNVTITDVIDYGVRLGKARDTQGSSGSGYANSLKIGGFDNTVTQYESYRPDGFLDLLASNGFTLQNATGTYDSSFVHFIYPAIRFPGSAGGNLLKSYTNITLSDLNLSDLAASTKIAPFGGEGNASNRGFYVSAATFQLNKWDVSGFGALIQSGTWVAGSGHSIDLLYQVKASLTSGAATIATSRRGPLTYALWATPVSTKVGTLVGLGFRASNANKCASVNWSPKGAYNGARSVTSLLSLSIPYSLTCRNADQTGGTASVNVQYNP